MFGLISAMGSFTMKRRATLLRRGIFVLAAFSATSAIPQVPPHYPGTICFTPFVWCQLPGAVAVGTPCYCTTPYGVVYGQAG
jgi:hypothetical protein